MVRKLAAFLLLLVIPVQVAATSMLSVQCAPAVAGAAVSTHATDGATNGQDDPDGKEIHHPFLCHQSVSAIPVIVRTGAAPDSSVFVPSVSLLSSLFIPEQPHRPPFVG
jgi:hypothetical protein